MDESSLSIGRVKAISKGFCCMKLLLAPNMFVLGAGILKSSVQKWTNKKYWVSYFKGDSKIGNYCTYIGLLHTNDIMYQNLPYLSLYIGIRYQTEYCFDLDLGL